MTKSRIQYKKKKRRFRPFVVILLTVLLLGLSYGGYLFFSAIKAANHSYTELDRGDKSNLRDEEVTITKDPISILITGVEDYTDGGIGRTDSIMVATLNPDNQSMKLLSIPRDTLVEIPDRANEDKINHAYAFGGKDLTIETVENFLDIPIDYYASVNFEGFKKIVDEIGGVTVDVPFDFWEDSDGRPRQRIYFTEGEMKLNGEEALAYARMRKQDKRGDFGRNERQQQIITAAIDSMVSPATLLKLDDIAKHVGENVETNISLTRGLSLQRTYPNINSSKIEKLSITGEDAYYDSIYYFVPDEEELLALQQELKAHLKHN
ncbi:LCP family protein [Sutcliffiella halmapala]|uniref:LCP family protein n=1 Tax=Sutcliffiella halmapala TaxID=79882 RepID=UPI0009955DD5|nr:LCP family protein [Sutcliffiella halmapala]